MPRLARLLSALLGAALLVSCGGAQPPQPPPSPEAAAPTAPAPEPTAAPAPTATPAAPAPTATTAPTAAVTLPPPTATPPLPTGLIDPTSAARLTPLRALGLGYLTSAAFMPDGTALVALTSAGLVWYTMPELTQARLDPVGIGFQLRIAPGGDLLAYTALSDTDAQRSVIRRTADASLVAEVEGAYPIFSPDGALVATGSNPYADPQRAWVWSAGDGAPVAELEGGTTVFSPGGAYVATAAITYAEPSVTRVYPARGGAPLLEVEATTPAFSPDDGLVAVSRGGQVEVYALPGGELKMAILTKVEAAASFSADGSRLLIVVGPDLWVWDVAANRELERVPGVNRAEEVFVTDGVRFGPGATTVVSFEPLLGDCPPGGVTIRAAGDGRLLYEDDASYEVALTADGAWAALSTSNGLRIANLASGTVVERPLGRYDAIALSPSGATLAASSMGEDEQGYIQSRVELWDLVSGEQRGELLTTPEDFVFSLTRIAFTPDGARVSALASYGCAAFAFWKVVSWDVASGQLVTEIGDLPTQVDADGNLTDRLPEPFAIAPDGSAAAWAGEGGEVVVRRSDGDDRTFTLPAPPTALAFNAVGLLAAYGDGLLEYIAVDGPVPQAIWGLDAPARELAFSPDGTLAVALYEGGGGEVLQTRDYSQVARLAVPAEATGASISNDGAVVVVAQADGLGLYDGASGALIGKTVGGTQGRIGPGRRLVASLEDGRVVLWGAP